MIIISKNNSNLILLIKILIKLSNIWNLFLNHYYIILYIIIIILLYLMKVTIMKIRIENQKIKNYDFEIEISCKYFVIWDLSNGF
jgi:hypothetical protein